MEINSDNLKKLFLSFNNDYKINREINPKNYFVKTEKIIEELNKVAIRANEYKRMTQLLFSDNTKKADLNQKYNLLLEEQKYFNIRYNDLENKYNDLLKNNQLLTVQLQNYVKQNNTNIDKYFKTIEELQQLKLEYMSAGIKREDYVKLQTDNDSLFREVSLLRIGMNTFKELYNTANYQIKQMKFIEMRNLDELDTYKRAIRELQGESNQNSLIGKLYYTILICRWREASTLRKYDDALGNITQLKLDNFALETNNKNLIKDLNEIQSNLHDKIIENIKIQDSLDNYESGLFIINTDKEKVYPLEEMKKLVNMLKEDKRNNTEKLLKLRKKVLNLENDKSYLENEIEFCESLANNIRFNNRDEYSQKLISMSEDISKLKLENKKLKREYDYIKESLEYNNRINQQLNQSLAEFEKKNVSLENKYRKMEEKYQRKNEENQKKLIEGLKNLKLDKSYNLKNIPNNNINNNINNNKVESDNKNIESLMKTTMNKYELNEQKIKQLNDIITKKDKEIETLKKINEDNIQSFKREKEFAKTITTKELVGKEGYELIKNEETNMMAKTMHQTVKVLQEMLNQKSLEINEKNKIIENLHNEISKSKSIYIQQINILKNQLTDKNKTTLSELQKLIEENNAKKIVDIKKKEINNTSIIELEKLLADKENEIKALNIELDGARMENKNNINKIEQLNKKLILFEDKLHEEKLKNNSMNALNEYYNKNFIQKLEEEMHLKNEMIEREKAKINEIYKKFSSNYQDKTLLNNDPSQKNQKMAQSVQLNDQEESKEKTELKKELDKYKNKNKNLVQEIKKLKQDIEELEKSKNEISLELYKNREDKKTILDLQVKDNKKIALLNKEKEKLKKENNKIKEEFEKLKLRLTDIEKSNDNLSNINYNLEQKLKNKGTTSSVPKIEGPKIDKKNLNLNLNQHKQNQFSVKASSNMVKIDDILNNICKYCIIKNLNLKKHLQRYDITRNGKIGQNDFKRAIEELKIGLINYDLEKLHNACKLPDSNDVSIENFLNLLKNKNAEFKKFLDEYPDTNEIIIKQGNKQASRKYENFEGKEFNIDY